MERKQQPVSCLIKDTTQCVDVVPTSVDVCTETG